MPASLSEKHVSQVAALPQKTSVNPELFKGSLLQKHIIDAVVN